MSCFLLKTEPSTYAYNQLEKDGKAVWDGVTNPVALKHIRSARKGDLVVVYHTGDEKRAVGIAEIASDPYPDPKDKAAKLTVFDLKPRRRLVQPVALATLKASAVFADSPLVRVGRLSVVPLTAPQWQELLALAKTKA